MTRRRGCSKILTTRSLPSLIERLHPSRMGWCQIDEADFLFPRGLPKSVNVLSETFEYARKHPEKTDPNDSDNYYTVVFEFMVGSAYGCPRQSPYPDGVDRYVMSQIYREREKLETRLREEAENQSDAEDEEVWGGEEDEEKQEEDSLAEEFLADLNPPQERMWDDFDEWEEEDEDDVDDEDEEGSRNPLLMAMTDIEWDAVETAIRNQVIADRETDKIERQLPREDSAPYARYNNVTRHFAFASEQARAAVPELDDALLSCRLRERPDNFHVSRAPKSTRSQRPLEMWSGARFVGFDVDEDLMAYCGSQEPYECDVDKDGPCVGFRPVPCLSSESFDAKFLDQFKDKNTGNEYPFDEDRVSFSTAGKKSTVRGDFTGCLADAENQCGWMATANGKVYALSNAADLKLSERTMGLLSFDEPESRQRQSFFGPPPFYNVARSGDCIVGSAGTR